MPPILYPRERQLLDFITQFIQRYGYAPTLKEIGEALNMGSPATVHEHVDKLRMKGYIKKLDGTHFYISIAPSMIAANRASYILQVKGTSMIDDGILDGDYVVVQHQQDAQNGDIVVALLPNGLATLKRIYFEKDRIKLMPANSQMSPIITTHVKIQGKVVGIIRKYVS
ncbi:MAG: LexA repressor [Candidatus Gottesmanbacteria bacterium GW2011_GWA2_47_9]|uniref:LexA repressor n=1 Tax=Candidatus Gottesmanbacteria bacterium GW2011_GWA2_47_9 TaxID=1618445 RepID=A0A0G1TZS8_9BACT|nr:MAG: LexA repressor [Candidatus Gottesmanbacteria bacterium GW2011_GWA2_47_9]